MAIEALLNPTFVHKPHHDLESILYIIIFICTFVPGPGLSLYESDISPPMRSWFSDDEIGEIGYRKLAHLGNYDVAILPNFAPYWRDFAPFVGDLIKACFLVKPHLPDELLYEQTLRVLKEAYDRVEEPFDQIPRRLELGAVPQASVEPRLGAQCSKRPNSSPALSHCDSKKGKRKASL